LCTWGGEQGDLISVVFPRDGLLTNRREKQEKKISLKLFCPEREINEEGRNVMQKYTEKEGQREREREKEGRQDRV